MDWQKLLNSAVYFCWYFIVQVAVQIGLDGKIPESRNMWIMLIVGGFLAANGKMTSSTRMSPFGYTRLTDAERRVAARLPLNPPTP